MYANILLYIYHIYSNVYNTYLFSYIFMIFILNAQNYIYCTFFFLFDLSPFPFLFKSQNSYPYKPPLHLLANRSTFSLGLFVPCEVLFINLLELFYILMDSDFFLYLGKNHRPLFRLRSNHVPELNIKTINIKNCQL